MSDIKLTTLKNGLRVITDHVPSVHSVALGIWSGVGTRDEDLSHNGAAHMVEHMLFKGTPNRSAEQIVADLETVGANMNAYTSREVTSYHVHLLKEHAPLAMDVLADMYQHSTMPEEEIERERHVILQEIGMCHDTPDDLIFDNYYETAYPNQSVGAPILGSHEKIATMQRDTLMNYVERFYSASRTVISAAGNIDHDEFVAQAASAFGDLPPDQKHKAASAQYHGGEHRLSRTLEQSHVVLGFQAPGRMDSDYYAVQALSNILGGGMASRLFQEVREKRGLVYSIFSFYSGFSDEGQFGIYAGTGPDDLTELVPVVCEEVLKVTENLLDEEVSRARAQLKSGLLMARESMMTRADQQAKNLLYRGEVIDIESRIAQIESVSKAQIEAAARRIFVGAKPTLASLGPLEKLESYNRITERLAA
jgi:predicted Zn-dependent peptidase